MKKLQLGVFSSLVQPILPDSVSPFQMYFIFDLTGAPCQCTVLINRVGSPERPSLSPILFQQSRGSVQSRREVLRLQVHSLEVSLCVWHCSNQQMQNTASTQGSHCAHECISTSVEVARFLPVIPMPLKRSEIACIVHTRGCMK